MIHCLCHRLSVSVINTNICAVMCPAKSSIDSVSAEHEHHSVKAAVLAAIYLTLMIHSSQVFSAVLIEGVVRALLETF